MNKKYTITDETVNCNGHILHRIKSLKDFGIVEKGDIGGFIETENNLSQEGDCWIFDDAAVYENALVKDSAEVLDEAKIYGNAIIKRESRVFGEAKIYGNVTIGENAIVYGTTELSDNLIISHNADIKSTNEVLDVSGITPKYKNITMYKTIHNETYFAVRLHNNQVLLCSYKLFITLVNNK